MKWIGDIADFSLRMRISAIFLLPVEVLVTDCESQTPISYSSLMATMALSGLVFEIWAWNRQRPDTSDRRQANDSTAYVVPPVIIGETPNKVTTERRL